MRRPRRRSARPSGLSFDAAQRARTTTSAGGLAVRLCSRPRMSGKICLLSGSVSLTYQSTMRLSRGTWRECRESGGQAQNTRGDPEAVPETARGATSRLIAHGHPEFCVLLQ
jgi:hypothetical protein